MAISTDALRMQLELEVVGAGVALDAIQRVSAAAKTANAESRAEALIMQRLALEGKFDPDAQREFAVRKLNQELKELNVSTDYYLARMQEINRTHANASTDKMIATGPVLDQHVIDYMKAEKKADQERVVSKERIAKEVARIQDAELTHTQRYTRAIAQFRNDRDTGLSDKTQFGVRVKAAKQEFQNAIAEENKLKELQDKRATAARNVIVMGDPGIVPLVNFTKELDNNSKAKRQAIALMRSYSDITQIAADDTAFFNAALANGSMTAADHARAIDGVNRRMRSMAGGAGNLGYVVGNVMTGLEDFTTVLSITGFGMDGFAAATRSASNNVGQAVRGFGTATAAMLAPMVSIGMVLVGFAIPAAYRWVTGAEDSAKATEKWRIELEKLQRIMTVASNEALLEFDRQMTEKDIKKMFDVDKLKDDASTATDAVKRLELELNNLADKHRATGMNALTSLDGMSGIMPLSTIDKFNKQVDFIGRALGGDVERELRDKMKSIQETFITQVSTLGGKEAEENFKKNIDNLINEMDRLRVNEIKDPNTDQRLYDIGSEFKRDINAKIDAARDELDKIDKSNTLAESAKREEIKTMEEKKRLLEEQLVLAQKMKDVREEGERLAESINNRAELENDLEILKIQNTKNRLLGDQFEAERRILDLSLRRREIMESGLAAPAVLEGMFNAELEAIAADITAKLAKLQDITVKTGMEGEAQAYTDTNRQIMEASKDQKVEEKEMIELLKAIREHLAGGNIMEVKVQ